MHEETPQNQEIEAEIERNLQSRIVGVASRTDKLFSVIMILQMVGCIIAALTVTPQTWAGESGSLHVHVWAACIMGALIAIPPAIWGWTRPGRVSNRIAFAISQMLFSSLIIHISGGRIESHFHIFGSIAFLAAYRDWRVIIVATAVAATDHVARGVFWPMSIFGVDQFALVRSLEHATWVIFEDIFILIAIYHAGIEMKAAASLEVMSRIQQQDVLRAELKKLRGAISAAANGDFTVEIDDSTNEDTQLLSADLRQMFRELRVTIGDVATNSNIVRERATEVAQDAAEVLAAAEIQRGSVDSIGQATCELKTTILEIRSSLDAALRENENANEQASLSESAIRQSEESISTATNCRGRPGNPWEHFRSGAVDTATGCADRECRPADSRGHRQCDPRITVLPTNFLGQQTVQGNCRIVEQSSQPIPRLGQVHPA